MRQSKSKLGRALETIADLRRQLAAANAITPSSRWAAAGEADPHGDRYNCERAALAMGDLSDDELANGAFMNYDQPLNLKGIMDGTHSSPIAWMTAVKDRIRWLSRQLSDKDAERKRLVDDNTLMAQTVQNAGMRIKELDLLFGRYLLGMRSAVIEMEHGRGAQAAMEWIVNGLAGPGELPPEDETDAQAYFDREIKAVDAGMAEAFAYFKAEREQGKQE